MNHYAKQIVTPMFVLLVFLFSVFSGCEQTTSDNQYDNPYDPENPDTHGDPYQLTAEIADGGIHLNWVMVPVPGIQGFNVYRRSNSEDFVQYQTLGQAVEYTDTAIENGKQYEYYVVARSPEGEAYSSNIATVTINTEPVLIVGSESSTQTPTREVTLTVLAFGATQMCLSNTEDFTGTEWEDYATTKSWQLETGPGTKTVYLKVVYAAGDTSTVISDDILPAPLAATVAINNDDDRTSTRHVTLQLAATGATDIQVSNEPGTAQPSLPPSSSLQAVSLDECTRVAINADSTVQENDLIVENWIPFADSLDWELLTGDGTKTVYVTFRNDFLIEETVFDQIDPAPLAPHVTINHGDEETASRTVLLFLAANGATHVQITNEQSTRQTFETRREAASLLFGNRQATVSTRTIFETQLVVDSEDEWIPFTDSLEWELLPGAGAKTVLVEFRNDFLIEDTASDDITPASLAPSLIILPDDREFINTNEVFLSMPEVGASEMKLSNTPDSSITEWIAYEDEVDWTLTDDDGPKRVFAWFRNDFFVADSPAVDSINVDTRVNVLSFEWSTTGGDVLAPGDTIDFVLEMEEDAFGAEEDGIGFVTVEGWEQIPLQDREDSSYQAILLVTPSHPRITDAVVTAHFTDRAENSIQPIDADETITSGFAAGEEQDFPLGDSGEMITMVWIPPGDFWMGAQENESDAGSDEYPRHQVTISEGFWIGKYEVTQSQWLAIANYSNFEWPGNPNRPAEMISWEDAVNDFLPEVNSGSDENNWRLPTEAEWEYACRAGFNDTWYWWGNNYDNLYQYAWYEDNSSNETHDVGGLLPNPWGLYDILGNVWEWCSDWCDNFYYEHSPDVDPEGPQDGTIRINRGSAWNHPTIYVRIAKRGSIPPSFRSATIGFRLVFDETPNQSPFEPTNPNPEDEEDNESILPTLTWSCSDPEGENLSYDVYFGSTYPLNLLSERQTETSFEPGELEAGTTYYWQIIAYDNHFNSTEGSEWSFTTTDGQPDDPPINPEHGDEWTAFIGVDDIPLEMIYIEGGTFWMGAQEGEDNAEPGEYPRHQVTISEGFWIGKYEVTQAQWLAVADYENFNWPGWPNRPAETVSWNDITNDFIPELGEGWRLPYEAEWEYICRAGFDETWFWWGNNYDDLGLYAWFLDNGSQTHEVGNKLPNPWGLYDILGNVYEWCIDWHDGNYYEESPNTDPSGPGTGSNRVVRGGAWTHDSWHCRMAFRGRNSPTARNNDYGFRLVREATPLNNER